jgi:hypothetical protein
LLRRWAGVWSKLATIQPPIWCEYERCGGRGRRKTNARRVAHEIIVVDGVRRNVCEGCADLMLRDLRAQGRHVERN